MPSFKIHKTSGSGGEDCLKVFKTRDQRPVNSHLTIGLKYRAILTKFDIAVK